jgi:hypothetical protein
VFSSTDLHSFNGTFATRLSKSLEFSGYAGVTRAETKFVQTVPVDPAIAALLGVVNAQQVVYGIRYIPNVSVRFSRAVHNGLFYVDAGRQITPGNGLFLTSDTTSAGGGYTYTGLRRWSFSVYGSYNRATSLGNIAGEYGGEGGWLTASRQIARNFHMLVGFTGTRYFSATYEQYNRPIYAVRVGFGWAPGDLPLRVW